MCLEVVGGSSWTRGGVNLSVCALRLFHRSFSTECWIAAGPRQHSDSWFLVPRDSGSYFTGWRVWELLSSSLALAVAKSFDQDLKYCLKVALVTMGTITHVFSMVTGFRNYCCCCSNLTNMCARHVVITYCRKLKNTALGWSPLAWRTYQI
jgi:hypothetical protein